MKTILLASTLLTATVAPSYAQWYWSQPDKYLTCREVAVGPDGFAEYMESHGYDNMTRFHTTVLGAPLDVFKDLNDHVIAYFSDNKAVCDKITLFYRASKESEQ